MGRTKGLIDQDDGDALQPMKPPSRYTNSMMPSECVADRKDGQVLKDPPNTLVPVVSIDPIEGQQTYLSSITQPSIVEDASAHPPSQGASLETCYPPPSSGISMIPHAYAEEVAPQYNPANQAKRKLEDQIATRIQEEYQKQLQDGMGHEESVSMIPHAYVEDVAPQYNPANQAKRKLEEQIASRIEEEYQREQQDGMGHEESTEKLGNSKASTLSSKMCILLLLLLLVVAGAVGAGVAVASSKKDKTDPDDESIPPTPAPNPRREYLLQTLGPWIAPNDSSEEWDLFDDSMSPQAQALRWMSEVDTITSEPEKMDTVQLLERYALTVLYYSTSGSTWGADVSFLDDTTGICSWNNGGIAGDEDTKGAICTNDASERVTYLALHNLSLLGPIPWEISLLESLVSLYMESNALSGSIPTHLGNLSNLRQLWLDSNALDGTVPATMPVSMYDLSLSDNMFSGTLSSEWGRSMPGLVSLFLGKNQFSGTLPTEFGNLLRLEQLLVHENNALRGTIPNEFANLSALQMFWFHRTELTGSVDSIFCDISSGVMPSSLRGDCLDPVPEIECTCCDVCCSTDGNTCSLNGMSTSAPTTETPTPAPTPYTRRSYLLQTLGPQIAPTDSSAEWALFDDPTTPQAQALTWMSEEDIFAAQPETLSTRILLERYALAVIYFSTSGSGWGSGTYFLDASTSVCEWNDRVDSDDEYKGTYCVYDDEQVSHLLLDTLNLQQTIPWEISLLESLYGFSVYDNYLTGSIPNAVLSIGQLTWLDLGYNIFTGSIPTEIGLMTDMQYLYLQQNYLTGTIPSEIGNLSKLVQFTVHVNSELSGTVPEEMKELEFLEDFYIHATSLTGSVDSIFCEDTSGLTNVVADCLGTSPEMECSCCVYCCDSDGGSCISMFEST